MASQLLATLPLSSPSTLLILSLSHLYKIRVTNQLSVAIHIPQQDVTRSDNDNQVCSHHKTSIFHQLHHLITPDVILQLRGDHLFNPLLECLARAEPVPMAEFELQNLGECVVA